MKITNYCRLLTTEPKMCVLYRVVQVCFVHIRFILIWFISNIHIIGLNNAYVVLCGWTVWSISFDTILYERVMIVWWSFCMWCCASRWHQWTNISTVWPLDSNNNFANAAHHGSAHCHSEFCLWLGRFLGGRRHLQSGIVVAVALRAVLRRMPTDRSANRVHRGQIIHT